MILNLTQHPSTPEQEAQGVFDMDAERRDILKDILTFSTLPETWEIKERAAQVIDLIEMVGHSCDFAMIGGAPYLMAPLEEALREAGVAPLYAFSERISEEVQQPDGTVRKVNKFRHLGFVEAQS